MTVYTTDVTTVAATLLHLSCIITAEATAPYPLSVG